jgi:hypothetical protein
MFDGNSKETQENSAENAGKHTENHRILTLVLILLSLGGICSFAFHPGSLKKTNGVRIIISTTSLSLTHL